MITYALNFKNGMSIIQNPGWICAVISAEREVTIVKHADEWSGFNDCADKYEKQNYVPGGPLLTVPSLAQMQQYPWYTNRFHKQASPVNTVRHFVTISATPGRMGYFTDIDLLQTAMVNEPIGTITLEMLDKAATVGYLQRLIAREVLRFSGYFDTRDFAMLQDVCVNEFMDLHYCSWMKEHCVLPFGLQGFSRYGYAEPSLEPNEQMKELPPKK